MRFNKFVWAASVATFVAVAIVLLTANAAPSSQDGSGDKQVATTSGDKMQSLLDFDSYKRLFKKSYSGFLENMVRFKLFTSRAIRASISAVKYRFRLVKFHLAINHMSDKSPEELDRMRNKNLERGYSSTVAAKRGDDLPEFIPDDDENVVVRLRNLIEENAGKPEFEALRAELGQIDIARKQRRQSQPSRRSKREVALAEQGPRELPLSKLINLAPEHPDAELPAETRAKIRARPKSNNPLYGGLELATQGIIDQQVKLNHLYIEPRQPTEPNLVDNLTNTLESLRRKYLLVDNDTLADAEPAKLPDEVFIDLRTSSNCLFAPRDQGECGSCYAFASTAVAEWLLCHTSGELSALSEQYLVDCGKAYRDPSINGCNGGWLSQTNEFFQNFGWELRTAYPYVAREQQCPYEADTDLRTVGYLRADLRNTVYYDISHWPEVLKTVGPLAVQMNSLDAFNEYGSGVFDTCEKEKPNHAVVLIGHGREDGEEYWLIRNSYSVGWGEAGHIKLSKKADCIWPRAGMSFGTDDGFNFNMKPFINAQNDGAAVQRHYDEHGRK